jgi:hypothetical protein
VTYPFRSRVSSVCAHAYVDRLASELTPGRSAKKETHVFWG